MENSSKQNKDQTQCKPQTKKSIDAIQAELAHARITTLQL